MAFWAITITTMKKPISNLHYITQDGLRHTHAQLAEMACAAGVNWVQLRIKGSEIDECKRIGQEVKEICKKNGAVFIINDNIELAYELQADGVHLGQKDGSIAEARTALGEDAIIGGTANTLKEVENLMLSGVDYIGLGPFRFTDTKPNLSPVLGLDGISEIVCALKDSSLPKIPIIAIGGITANDIEPLLNAGVSGIAVSSAINKADNIREAVRAFTNKLTVEV